MQSFLRTSMDSTKSLDRPRAAMDCITNTHGTNLRPRTIDKKRRLSSTTRPTHKKGQHSLDLARLPSQVSSSKLAKDGTFADTVRASMLRRGYQDILSENAAKADLLQTRRRGYSESSQFFPLQIQIPPTTTLCDLEGRFENPRKAPLPGGLQYNTVPPRVDTPPATDVIPPSTPIVEHRTPEFNNLSQVSVFALPKFDPEKEMRMLQNLWSKRCSIGDPQPLICRASRPSQEVVEDGDEPTPERSFFETDSDSEDEEFAVKRKPWKLGRRNARGSFTAIRRALTGEGRFGFKEFPNNVVPGNWKKTFSLCDHDGDQLLVMETTSDRTHLIAGTISGIAFELFRSHDDDTKRFLIRSHSLYTTTSGILDTIHACLLKDECRFYWQSPDTAALKIMETLALWRLIQPRDFVHTMRRQQLCDMMRWCAENVEDDGKSLCESVEEAITTNSPRPVSGANWLMNKTRDPPKEDPERQLLNIQPWELAHYLAIYDYLYISGMLEDSSLEDLLAPIAKDEISILTTPDLRADQIQYWVTIKVLDSPSMSLRMRWICLFIETAMALVELSDYFSAFLICNALYTPEVQGLTASWRKIPPELINTLREVAAFCQTGQSWSTHLPNLQSQRRSCLPYLPCVLRELRNINTSQPTNVKFQETCLSAVDDPVIIPAPSGTGMINLRKFRQMYDVLNDALAVVHAPYSYWYKLFPEDTQFPARPKIADKLLDGWESVRRMVERDVGQCWDGGRGDGNWERSLHVKKILASAGF